MQMNSYAVDHLFSKAGRKLHLVGYFSEAVSDGLGGDLHDCSSSLLSVAFAVNCKSLLSTPQPLKLCGKHF